ncbi:MAG: N-acetylmuramoyl-L-alanine amidase [Paludibacteraceae bacterium]|nr:N-acetylmuramoyl-L-alanine amidase [Paludibacteraceae bacterium]
MKQITLLALLLLSTASYSQQPKNAPLPIIDLTAQVNFGHRIVAKRNIDIIVVHSTYAINKDSFLIDAVLNQFKPYKVCPHYVIGREGEIYLTVAEKNIAYHAGVSTLPGTKRSNLNTNSIGIEIINSPSTPPTDAQYESLLYLIQDIQKRHKINHIVRHSDIAPDRKTDPWLFNWDVFMKMVEK